jgi:WD40 repeat protein
MENFMYPIRFKYLSKSTSIDEPTIVRVSSERTIDQSVRRSDSSLDRRTVFGWCGFFAAALVSCFWTSAVFAADAKPKVNYQEHVLPILQNRCASCHNADKQKGGLTLDNYAAALRGGGSGKAIEPGDPDSSTLYRVVSHLEEPFMPPKQPKLPDGELDVLKKWIEAGAPETSGSAVAIAKKPKFEFKLDPAAVGKPNGTPATPHGLSTEPSVVSRRPNAITAIAASPWAPVVAVAGHKQVLLYHTSTLHLLGTLPFNEGIIHTLKFSRNGDLLAAGGGRGGQSGRVVVWDVRTGARVFEVGREYDAVLAADISPDQGLTALGGPGKVVRVFNTSDGSLVFEERKHTDWITAIAFSPDGVLLATGDRSGGVFVWEAGTGREFHELRGHNAAITDLDFRLDSNVLATASEDSTVRLWEMENGGTIKNWGAHGGGTESVKFAKDGRLITTGRDHVCRLWDQNGGKQREFEAFGDLALRSVFTYDDQAVFAGDFSGEVRAFKVQDGSRIGSFKANPAPLAVRLEEARRGEAEARSAADRLVHELESLKQTATERSAKFNRAQTAAAGAEQAAAKAGTELVAATEFIKKLSSEEVIAQTALKSAIAAVEPARAARSAAEKAAADKQTLAKAEQAKFDSARNALEAAERERSIPADRAAACVLELKFAKSKAEADAALSRLNENAKLAADKAPAVEAAFKAAEIARQASIAANTANDTARSALQNANALAQAAEAKLKTAQAAIDKMNADKTNANRALAAAQTLKQAADSAVAASKTELAQALAAKNQADKALGEKSPAVEAAIARAAALRAEVEALAAEKKAIDEAKAATAGGK